MKKILLILFIAISITSCDLLKTGNQVEIEVLDTTAWSPENPFGNRIEGAIVKLLDIDHPDINSPLYEQTTRSSGIAKFDKIPDGDYYVYIEKGTLSNLTAQEMKDGVTVGFLIYGMFQSQAEVEETLQPNASVGAPKIIDHNGDRVYNSNDKVPGNKIFVNGDEISTHYIADKILLLD